jgi:hypothetical protein
MALAAVPGWLRSKRPTDLSFQDPCLRSVIAKMLPNE